MHASISTFSGSRFCGETAFDHIANEVLGAVQVDDGEHIVQELTGAVKGVPWSGPLVHPDPRR